MLPAAFLKYKKKKKSFEVWMVPEVSGKGVWTSTETMGEKGVK